MTEIDLAAFISTSLGSTPQWIRHDLSASDPALRTRAEESLAAIVAAALASKSGLQD